MGATYTLIFRHSDARKILTHGSIFDDVAGKTLQRRTEPVAQNGEDLTCLYWQRPTEQVFATNIILVVNQQGDHKGRPNQCVFCTPYLNAYLSPNTYHNR